jgi:hypothetical protein
MMGIKTYFEVLKAVIFGAVLIFFICAGYYGIQYVKSYMNFNNNLIKDAQNREFKQYLDSQARAHTEIVNSLKSEIKELGKTNKAIVDDIKRNGEKIKNIGTVQTKMNENLSRKLKEISDHEYKAGTGDYNEQYFKKIMAKTKNEEGKEIEIPVGWAMFFPNREPEKQWKTGIYPLKYYLKIIQAEQKTGQLNTYAEAWVETNKPKKYRGIQFPLKIKEMEFKQLKRMEKEFYWWAPHLSLNLDYYLSTSLDNNVAGGISFSVMGHGKTKSDLDWKFAELGISSNGDDTYFKFMPFSYNIGKVVPLISNTFLSPFIGYGDEVVYGFGLSVIF